MSITLYGGVVVRLRRSYGVIEKSQRKVMVGGVAFEDDDLRATGGELVDRF